MANRLLWRLFPIYSLIVVAALATTGIFLMRALSNYHEKRTLRECEVRLKMIAQEIEPMMETTNGDSLQTFCRRVALIAGDRLTVVLPDGKVVAESDRPPNTTPGTAVDSNLRAAAEDLESLSYRPEFRQALGGHTASAVRKNFARQADVLYVAMPLMANGEIIGAVRAAVPLERGGPNTKNYWITLGLVMTTALLLVTAITAVISRFVSRPILNMQHGAERFAAGDFGLKVEVPRSAEFAGLAEALNRMAAQLDDKIRTITLQRNEREAILASLRESVIALDASERILFINRAAMELMGVDDARAVGRLLPEVVRNSRLQQFIGQMLAGAHADEGEVTIDFADDRILQVTGTSLRNVRQETIGVLVVINDVTRLRKLEEMRREFVANVSHELKTPITTIQGFVETLADSALEDREVARGFLERIEQNAIRLNAIIDDLLSLSRVERDGSSGRVQLATGSLGSVAAAAISHVSQRAAEFQIDIELVCQEDISAHINATLLEQAITNLLDNAIKYSDPGKRVEVEVVRSDRIGSILVRDHGLGIAAEHLPRLFERFYRVDKARSRKLGGTGLGLAIVKHIVQAHGGRVTAASEPGKGSVFGIHLPAN